LLKLSATSVSEIPRVKLHRVHSGSRILGRFHMSKFDLANMFTMNWATLELHNPAS
jgi:hypothetical protein